MTLHQTHTTSLKLLLFSLTVALIANYTFAQKVENFHEVLPTKKFAVSGSGKQFWIDLGYDRAFQIEIAAYNNVTNATGFCQAYPEIITSELDFTAALDFEGVDDIQAYDNIIFYKNYYFILDSLTYSLIVTNDVTDIETSYLRLESELQNEVDENGDYEEPFMIVSQDGILYIVTAQTLLTENLNGLIDVLNLEGDELPVLNKKGSEFKGYESILNVVHSHDLLFIVADNKVDIYQAPSDGSLKLIGKFDAAFFGVEGTSLSDIAIRGKYAFVLDSLSGVFVVDISTYNGTGKLTYLSQFNQIKIQKGKFIEIVGHSLNIVVNTKPFSLEEYIIKGDDEMTGIVYNRKLRLGQSVRDTSSDSNFVYLLSGAFNMVIKPSIPGKYNSTNVTKYLTNYWQLFGAKAIVSVTNGLESYVVAVNDNYISILNFKAESPFLSCNMSSVAPGTYTYLVKAVESNCPAKEKNLFGSADDFNVVCEIEENIMLYVAGDGAQIGNLSRSEAFVRYLAFCVAVLVPLAFMFLCFARKYKKQYRTLEDEIKFHKLEEDAEQSGKQGEEKTDADVVVTSNENIHTQNEFIKNKKQGTK